MTKKELLEVIDFLVDKKINEVLPKLVESKINEIMKSQKPVVAEVKIDGKNIINRAPTLKKAETPQLFKSKSVLAKVLNETAAEYFEDNKRKSREDDEIDAITRRILNDANKQMITNVSSAQIPAPTVTQYTNYTPQSRYTEPYEDYPSIGVNTSNVPIQNISGEVYDEYEPSYMSDIPSFGNLISNKTTDLSQNMIQHGATPELANVMVRDYSALMKTIDKKKGIK
jgi:hypothetical protein